MLVVFDAGAIALFVTSQGEGQVMANQWALLIGINQYKALQPLMYAQPDAVELRNFFVDELGVPVNQCTLLTDVSAAIEPHAYMPLRQEVVHHLQTLCREQVQPGDLLWVFFSGCGLTEAGQDYWMTIDAEPTNLSETAIPLSQIFEILNEAKTDQIVLAMDMNRSQGAVGHRDIGAQTLTLAKDYGITTFLSCQPEQFSHETLYVRHGLFTKALLEGLRYHGCVTASQLGEYLSDRVPELCEHHHRPSQNPVMVVPQTQKFMMVVPAEGLANLSPTENLTAIDETPLVVVPGANGGSTPPTDIPDQSLTTEAAEPPLEPVPPPETPPAEVPPSGEELVTDSPDDDSESAGGLSGLWKWGALAAAIAFLAGVFFRFQPLLFGEGEPTASDTPADVVGDEPDGTEGPEGETTAEGEVPPADVAPADSPDAVAENNAEAPDAVPPEQEDPLERGKTALQRAKEALDEQRYGEARAWLTQVPPELQNNRYQNLLEEANSEVAEAAVRNQTILNNARQVLQPTSASMFNDAIEQARQVPPEDPYYEQAQADIQRWGGVILDLAEGRAASGNIAGAIAAARLVPEDQPELTTLAAQRIQTWEQQIANQDLIQQTQNSLQPGQASSYNDAVRTLEQIEPGQPGYDDARARMQQWGQDILAIARARAAQGDLGGAIGAARLVPESTDAFGPAQEEIQRWQAQ